MIKKNTDLIFIYYYANVQCHIEPDVFSKKEEEEIRRIVKCMSREIHIDKSYVKFPENKHEKVFLTLEGWNELCTLAYKTKFGKKATKKQHDDLCAAHTIMILCYLYQILEDFDYYSDSIYLDLPLNSYFMVEYHEDKIHAWKDYPGKWQTWK